MLQHTRPIRAVFLLTLLVLSVVPAFAEEDPLSALQGSLWFPRGLGTVLISPQSRAHPLGALSLPHLSSDTRVAVLGGAGGGVLSDGSVGGAFGLTVPGQRIVWTGALGISADGRGSAGRGTLALARPLGSRFAAGASFSLLMAGGEENVAVGGGVDLGARYRLGALGDFSRVEAHAAILNIGNSVSRNPYTSYNAPFTPLLGMRSRVFDSTEVEIDAAATIRLERFQNLWASAAVNFRISQNVNLALGVDLPLDGRRIPLWPGLDLSIRIPIGGERSDFSLAAQPTTDGSVLVAGDFLTAFSSSDIEPPVLRIEMVSPVARFPQTYGAESETETSTTMPGLSRDSIGLAPSSGREQLVLRVFGEDNRAIKRLGAELFSPNGEVLRQWNFEPVGEPVIEGDVASRLTSDLAHRSFGSTVVWGIGDAFRDGRYRLQVVAEDAAGNETRSAEIGIVVDTVPPAIRVEVHKNGDRYSSGDSGPIELNPESPITARVFYDDAELVDLDVVDEANRSVFRLDAYPDMAESAALEAEWSGQDSYGNPVPEGLYRFRARGEDEYGNGSTAFGPEIIARRTTPTFRIGIDRTVVSPIDNGEAVRAVPELSPLPGLREWTIRLFRDRAASLNEPVRSWSGIDLPPAQILLQGEHFPEDGRYYLSGFARYSNGGLVEERTTPFVVDRVAPEINIGLSDIVLMPSDDRRLVVFVEGDGTAQTGRIRLRGSDLNESREEASVVLREFDQLPDEFEWSLVLPDGTFLKPGLYELWLEGEDRAGNVGRSPVRRFELVPRLEGAEITPQRTVFSPVMEREIDAVVFALRGPADADRGDFSVVLTSGDAVRRMSGSLPLPNRLSWDGRDDQGVPFPDGAVTATLTISVPDRGEISAVAEPVKIDTIPPVVFLERAGPEFVSPDGDGVQDTILLRADYGDAATAELTVRDQASGNVVRRISQPVDARDVDQGVSIKVEPRGEDGTVLQDGRYLIQAQAVDAAGNQARSDAVAVTIDTRPVGGFLRVSSGSVSPTGNGIADTLRIQPVVPDVEGLLQWELSITPVDDSRRSVLQREGSGPVLPEQIEWPRPDDPVVSDGDYQVRLLGQYRHGPVLDITSPVITVDTASPEVAVEVSPQPFSPDGDGRDDTVSFEFSVDDVSPVEYWILEVFDPTGAFFYDVGGRGGVPNSVVWDGLARNGERVVSAEKYPWRFEVADELGNITVVEDELEIDVLVEQFEDGYRIQIPSITFPGNSANLILDATDPRGQQNREVIDRLVEILGRFPEYSITVEGHAVNLSGTEREESDELIPLSRRRAEAVREALIERGVAARLLSARGRGGRVPLVPHEDELNRWKNRRVDFILQR